MGARSLADEEKESSSSGGLLSVHWDHSSQNASGIQPTFTSERLCWRPPRRPSASRSAPPAAPPSCWPWPPGARGCPESQTCLSPRSGSDLGNKRRRNGVKGRSGRKANLYGTGGAAEVTAGSPKTSERHIQKGDVRG